MEAYENRRDRLVARMQALGGGIALLPTAPEAVRNRDTHYPYRFDSYFYYLTGFREPEAVLAVIAGDIPKSILFCREKNLEREIWDGYRYGPEAAQEAFGFDEARPIEALDEALPDLLAGQPTLFTSFGFDEAWDRKVTAAMNGVRANARAGAVPPRAIHDLRGILDAMRMVKDATEIEVMRRAAAISDLAHRRAMAHARPGQYEYEVEAEILHVFRRGGSQYPAYPSIVASGHNACVLHYIENDRLMQDGELLLIDAGCELDGYASDITRTFPINGRFSAPQRALYDLVLASQEAARAEIRPGASWNAPHEATVKVLAQGFIDLGLLPGSLDEVLEKGSYRQFYMHRTGHWLGLDVHDAGDYKRDGEWVALEPGMLLTVEPGCYVRPAEGVPEAFWNIGIRIEDNALVTPEGCEYITEATPRTAAEIEALIAEARDA